jgi:hypothetical protein
MDNYIIKGAGTIDEITEALARLKRLYGSKITLHEMHEQVLDAQRRTAERVARIERGHK